MPQVCENCGKDLDDYGLCPSCDTGPAIDLSDLPKTKPVESDSPDHEVKSDEPELDDMEDIPELSPEDIKIDFDKIDTSTLFDDEFEEKEISSKMLPVMQKKDSTTPKREIKERPVDQSLERRAVFGIQDRVKGSVEETRDVSYRTKGSMVKKKGTGLVIFIALSIIFLIIVALWLTGFLNF